MEKPVNHIELDAAAWELTGLLGIEIIVQGNDLVLNLEQLDDWWASARDRVMDAYEKYVLLVPAPLKNTHI